MMTILSSPIFWTVFLILALVVGAIRHGMRINAEVRRKRDAIRRSRCPEQRRAWAAYLGERTKAERLRRERKALGSTDRD